MQCGPLTTALTSGGTLFLSGTNADENNNAVYVQVNGLGRFLVNDQTTDKKGVEYSDDYSDSLKNNPLSLPDVGTVKKIISEQVKSGLTTGTTDAAGFLEITHGFGTTPTTVVTTYQGSTPICLTVTAKTSTTFTVRAWNMLDGAWETGASIGVNWIAK